MTSSLSDEEINKIQVKVGNKLARGENSVEEVSPNRMSEEDMRMQM